MKSLCMCAWRGLCLGVEFKDQVTQPKYYINHEMYRKLCAAYVE